MEGVHALSNSKESDCPYFLTMGPLAQNSMDRLGQARNANELDFRFKV